MVTVALRGALPRLPGQAQASTRRNGGIDALRFAAALVIVLFHAKVPVGGAMAAAMGVFVAVLACHAASGSAPMAQVLRNRSDRLIRPFLIWAAIYAALRVADAAVTGRPVVADLMDWLPPEGTMAQLWFLPFGFAVCIGITALRSVIGPGPGPVLAAVSAVVGTLLWLGLALSAPLPIGLQVFVNYLPSVFFGTALAAMAGQRQAMILLGAAAVGTGFAAQSMGAPASEQLWVGIPLVVAAYVVPLAATPALRRATDLTMAIYLLHPLLIAALLRLVPFDIGSAIFGVLAMAGSVAVAAGLAATRFGRLLT